MKGKGRYGVLPPLSKNKIEETVKKMKDKEQE